MRRFMQIFFYLLYHPFAFAYDLVAAIVSFGHWTSWAAETIPFIQGTRILEIGHGPGHLQRRLLDLKVDAVAIDESAQMGMLAKRRLGHSHKLTRGLAQHLPFADNSFHTVVSTFPTDYIFHAQTLSEISRCLATEGRLVVLPVATPKNSALKRLYRATGETQSDLNEALKSKLTQPFIQAGFETETQIIEVKSSSLLIVVAKRPMRHDG
jgi:ubiquinone/menaquinone biosynthesis C-methylase UbiE